MLSCTNEVSTVDGLWIIALFWSILFYIVLGCAGALGIIFLIDKAKQRRRLNGEISEVSLLSNDTRQMSSQFEN